MSDLSPHARADLNYHPCSYSAERIERFDDLYIPEPNSGCWLWIGASAGKGYGNYWNGEKLEYAHRFSYRAFVAPIPDRMVIDHLCRVHCCVNPRHLEPVTYGENIRRGALASLKRIQAEARTECRNGHPLVGENLAIRNNARTCRTCYRAVRQARRHRQSQEAQHV